MTFARGGHPARLLLTHDGRVETLQADGGLLGIFPNETYTDGRATLVRGRQPCGADPRSGTGRQED